MSELSRRTLVTSAAALPALAVPAVAIAASAGPDDPIFEAIEAHRNALLLRFEKGAVEVGLRYDDPRYAAASEQMQSAVDQLGEAEFELATTVPVTMAGVMALLRHVESHHHQEIVLPEDPNQWYSQAQFFGSFEDEEIRERFNGEPVEFELTFWIMRNVKEALETIEVQS
jgi:hypothetical protein